MSTTHGMVHTKIERLSRCGFDGLNGQDKLLKSCEQRTQRVKASYTPGLHEMERGGGINYHSRPTLFTIQETRAVYPHTFEGYVQRKPVTRREPASEYICNLRASLHVMTSTCVCPLQ